MLAKMWKKVLLAICIIACIYNIMSKLVNRGSLEANLHRANDGNTVFDFSSKKSDESEQEVVDGVIMNNNTSTKNTIKINTNAITSEVVENEEQHDAETEESNTQAEEQENEPEEEKKSTTMNFKDFIFKW